MVDTLIIVEHPFHSSNMQVTLEVKNSVFNNKSPNVYFNVNKMSLTKMQS